MSSPAGSSNELAQLFARLDEVPSMYDVTWAPPLSKEAPLSVDAEEIKRRTVSRSPNNLVLARPEFQVAESVFFADGEQLVITGLFDVVPKHLAAKAEIHEMTEDEYLQYLLEQDEHAESILPVDPLTMRGAEPYVSGLVLPQAGAQVARYESGVDKSTRYKVASRAARMSVWAEVGGDFLTVRSVEQTEPEGAYSEFLGYLGERSSTTERAWALRVLQGIDPQQADNHSAYYEFELYENPKESPIHALPRSPQNPFFG